MALYRDIKLFSGSTLDRFGAIPTITGSKFSKKEKGYALETGQNKYVQYDRQLLPNGAFSVVVWARLKPTHIIGTDRAGSIASVNTGGDGLNLYYPNAGTGLILFLLGTTNWKFFNYSIDRNWHCYIVTIPGSGQTDILNSILTVDGNIIPVNGSPNTSSVQYARSVFTFVGGSSSSTSGFNISRIKVYDHVLSTNEINAEQVEFTFAQPISKPKRGFEYPKPTDLSQFKGSGVNQGLIGSYNCIKLNNILTDTSGNLKNGTVTGCVSTKNGMLLNSISDKIVLGNIGNVKSIAFRIKFKTTSEKILEKAANSGLIYTNAGTLTAADFANKYINGVSGTSVVAGQWLNICLTSSTDVVFSAVTLGLNNTTYGAFEIADLRFWNRELSVQEVKNYNNQYVKVYIADDLSDASADGTTVVPNGWISGTGSYKVVENTTQDSVLKHITKGTKFLQCVTAGTIAIPSQQAYGSCEWDWYKGADGNAFRSHFINSGLNINTGYSFSALNNEIIILNKWTPAQVDLMYSGVSYITNNTWYRTKITRTTAGVFTVLIKGGAFTPTAGYDGWTLVSITGGSGTNPVTDNTYTTSNYFVLDLDASDRFANLIMKDGIKE